MSVAAVFVEVHGIFARNPHGVKRHVAVNIQIFAVFIHRLAAVFGRPADKLHAGIDKRDFRQNDIAVRFDADGGHAALGAAAVKSHAVARLKPNGIQCDVAAIHNRRYLLAVGVHGHTCRRKAPTGKRIPFALKRIKRQSLRFIVSKLLRRHLTVAAVSVKAHRICPRPPHGVKQHIVGNRNFSAVGITFPAAVGHGVPADKIISVADKRVCLYIRRHVFGYNLQGHIAAAAVCVKAEKHRHFVPHGIQCDVLVRR